MNASAVTRQRMYAELSDNERRSLKMLAASQGIPLERLVGLVLREYLNENGLPIEGSVKA